VSRGVLHTLAAIAFSDAVHSADKFLADQKKAVEIGSANGVRLCDETYCR
jgi:hypothetical protein